MDESKWVPTTEALPREEAGQAFESWRKGYLAALNTSFLPDDDIRWDVIRAVGGRVWYRYLIRATAPGMPSPSDEAIKLLNKQPRRP